MARAVEEVGQARPTRPERVPPHNLEAEESVLGSMLLSAEAIASVIEVLAAEDFYRSAHERIYRTVLDLYGKGEPVDAITVTEDLKRAGALDQVGGPLAIYRLVESVPTVGSARYYAQIVSDHALLRRLIDAAARIMQMAYSVPAHPEQAADEAEGLVYAASRQRDQDEVVALSSLIHSSIEDLERLHERESAYVGVPTGFIDLDEKLSGLQPGNLIIVAARPGIGKSSLVTNVARNVAVDQQVPVAMFSLEMSRMEIGMRLLCAEAKVPWDKIRAARVAAEDWHHIVEGAETLHQAPLYIVDSGNMTIVDIRAKARRLKSDRQIGLGLIIVDYLQLMSSHQFRVENRQTEIAEISRSLKLLAKELQIPVIAVSQLNRDPERRQDKRPQLADLRECVTGDTLVTLADGRRVAVRGLVGTTPEVLAVSQDGRLMEARSDKVWAVGRRPVFKVRLASGRQLRCTARHRLLGAEGWVRVEDLTEGDRVAIARRLPEPAHPEEWPDDRVVLLGQLIGDGSYLTNAPMRYTTASEENSATVTMAAQREFGATVKRYAGRRSWHQLMITGNGNRWHPAGVNAWLRELGIFGQRSHEKRVPAALFRLSNRQVGLFLQHLWATDGSIVVRPAGRPSGDVIYLAASSQGLASDAAALLLRLGVIARTYRVPQGTYRPSYHVVVKGVPNERRFLDLVGAFGSRRRQAANLMERVRRRVPNTNVDTLPKEIFDRVQRVMAERGITPRAMAEARGKVYAGSAHFGFAPSRDVVMSYAAILDDGDLRSAATNDLFWDRVTSIEPDGEDEVFDLTVPGPASWVADSVISHNSGSLEQDSDIVLFIYREDSEDPQVKGTAKLIVAKNRNGPTGDIQLTFLPHLTKFGNYARVS